MKDGSRFFAALLKRSAGRHTIGFYTIPKWIRSPCRYAVRQMQELIGWVNWMSSAAVRSSAWPSCEWFIKMPNGISADLTAWLEIRSLSRGWSAFKFKKHCLLKMEECWTEQEAPRLPCVGQKGLHRKTIPPRKKKPTVGQCEGRVAKQRKRLDQKNRISEIKEAHLVTIRLA